MKDNFTISKEKIIKILQKNRLGQLTSFKEIYTGLINPIFLINNQFILRINTKNSRENKQKFEKEAFLYHLLPNWDIPTPHLLVYDRSGDLVKEDYLLISYIKGETLTKAFEKGNKAIRGRLSFQLGRIAKKIHSVSTKEISLKNDLFGLKTDWKKSIETEFATYFNYVKQKQLLPRRIIEHIDKVATEYSQLGDISEKFSLIHGDFSRNNLQVRDGQIVGIFDFEMAKLGDPFYDLQKLPINFQLGPNFEQKEFLFGYQQTEFTSKEKIRLKYYSLLQGLWEIWATETQQFPFGKKEILEGKNIISKTLNF